MSKGEGKKIVIRFTEDIVGEVVGNELAFSIKGKEHLYVQGLDYNGKLVDKQYKPISVEKHPTVEKALLLSFSSLEKFNNSTGNLNVTYNAQIGNLSGRGGRVDDFTVNFKPTDLISTPNPGVTEVITVAPTEIVGTLSEIEYPTRYSEHGTITVAPVEVIGTLLSIDEINP